MNVAIIDDKESSIGGLLEELDVLKLRDDLNIFQYHSSMKFLDDKKSYDIVFVDVDKSEEIQTLNRLRKYNQKALIIICANNMELCQDGYLVNAFRFLHKGDKKERFEEAVKSAIETVSGRKKIALKVTKGKKILIDLTDIVCIECHQRGTKLHTENEEIISIEKISKLENELTEPYFYQPHRAFIINLNYLKSYEKKDIYLKNGLIVPLSEKKMKEFKKVYLDWIFEQTNK